MNRFRKLFNATLISVLCLTITNCGGFNISAGVKFKKDVDTKSYAGNPGFTGDVVKLSNGTSISFNRPIGHCGAEATIFGILIPIIPVKFNLNSCEKSFSINSSSLKISNLKLRYDGNVHESFFVEKLIENTGYEYGKKFKFKIDNFWKFRMADDKAIIVTGKTKDGEEFTEELPVKWGVMTYNHWAIP